MHHHKTKVALAPAPVSQVYVLQNPTPMAATLSAAMPQFSRGAPPIFLKSGQAALSLSQTMLDVQQISDKPVLAMTEYRDWFWYATDVSKDMDTQDIQSFRSGYAVQKNGHLAWKWSME